MNDEHDNAQTDKEMAERLLPKRGRYNPRREFRVRDARRWKTQKDARYYGEEVEISMRIPGHGNSQSFVMSDEDLMELCIKALTYLRDKAEGLAGPRD